MVSEEERDITLLIVPPLVTEIVASSIKATLNCLDANRSAKMPRYRRDCQSQARKNLHQNFAG